MTTAVRGTLLAAAPLLSLVPLMADAYARTGSDAPTTDATCVFNGRGTFADAVEPGGVSVPVADTLVVTGTVTCVDQGGAPVASGKFARTVTVPAARCTGDEHGDTSSTTVYWSDTAISTFELDRTEVVKVNGTASLDVSGHVAANSARFADDTVRGLGTSTGAGCGTSAGERAVDSTLVLRFGR
ncbi:hypothetical protein [Kitasatospora sp. CB01950]|uniref:hypothetical protein n=1 Tax=Kitasatospora sp. CB01950 TaxID=1703930 RepID=UPI0009389EA7|nr:hypothetical protein [Kitasatospora sp. CB01950]OKJ09230.1 hypothetical protein AMK19_17815 [Kitasatospora sp. CB01950]